MSPAAPILIKTAPQKELFTANPSGKGSPVASMSWTVPVGSRWTLTRITVATSSGIPSQAAVFVNGTFQLGTNAGNGDSATGNPIPLVAGDVVQINWLGGNVGATATGTLTYVSEPE